MKEKVTNQTPVEKLKLDQIGLDPKTLLILKNKVDLKAANTPAKVTEIAQKLAALLFPDKKDHHLVYGWVIYACMHDMVDLSYLVTTPEGKKFEQHYIYLHTLVGTLYAHAKTCAPRAGNVFMVYGGKRYINQFPNPHHTEFIKKLVNLPEDEETWNVSIFGGEYDGSYTSEAKEYILALTEMPDTFSESGLALAGLAASYGAPTMSGLFLRDISPRDVRDKKSDSKIAQIYLARVKEVKQALLTSGQEFRNPSLLIEYLIDYLESDTLYTYEGDRILHFIYALKNSAGNKYSEYQQLLMSRVNSLGIVKTMPDVVLKALESSPN